MKARCAALVAGVVLASLLPPAVAGGNRQLRAKDEPSVSGPLGAAGSRCKNQRERFRNEVVAVGRSCIRVLRFDQDAESDRRRNYGVVWMQSTINPSPRWCALKAVSDIDLPPNVSVVGKTPRRRTDIDRRTERRIKIKADTEQHSSETGSVSQRAIFRPRVVTRAMADEGAVYRVVWRGSSRAKLAFISGVEISWRQGNQPQGISFGLNYEMKRKGRC